MDEFNSLEQLYIRLNPALNSKMNEIKVKGFGYIKKIDIWNYLSKYEWNNKKDLSLYEMVDDILNIDNIKLNDYVLNILNKQDRKIEFNDNDLL